MKNIAIIGSVGYPSKYGNTETFVKHLVEDLGNKVRFTVYCSANKFKKSERLKSTFKLRTVYLPFKTNGFQGVLYQLISMIHALFVSKTFLILGVSGCFALPLLRIFTSKKLIVNIDEIGYNNRNLLVRVLLKWSEKIAVKWAHSIVTNNEAIKQYFYTEYSVLSERIEYGSDHMSKFVPDKSDYTKYLFLGNRFALTVARIEPENNIEIILKAFTKIDHNLVVVGNWNQTKYARNLKSKYAGFSNIILLNDNIKQQTIDFFRSHCSVYIHGNSTNKSNLTLIENMYLSVPIIAFDIDFNKETTEYKSEYFSSVDSLRDAISMINFFELNKNGEKMFEIAMRRYLWQNTSSNFLRLFLTDKHVLNQSKKIHYLNFKNQKYLQAQELYQLLYKRHYFEEID